MVKEKDISLEAGEIIKVKLGSEEFEISKTFLVKDLKKIAGVYEERDIVLYRKGEAFKLEDDDKITVEEGDYFKDIPSFHPD